MAYNLYQVQMARAWAERIEKENAQQEKFWHSQTMKSVGSKPSSPSLPAPPPVGAPGDLYFQALESRSVAGMSAARSAAPTGFTSKTSYLKSRLEKLESDLQAERESRKRVEEDLASLRNSMRR